MKNDKTRKMRPKKIDRLSAFYILEIYNMANFRLIQQRAAVGHAMYHDVHDAIHQGCELY